MTTIPCPHCGRRIQLNGGRNVYTISITTKGREWLRQDKEKRG